MERQQNEQLRQHKADIIRLNDSLKNKILALDKNQLSLTESDKLVFDHRILGYEQIQDEIRMQPLGKFHGEEVQPVEEGTQWYGLYQKEESFELQKVQPGFHSAFDEVAGDSSGIRIAVDSENKPLMLFANHASLKPGPLKSVHVLEECVYPGEALPLNLPGPNETKFLLVGIGNQGIETMKGFLPPIQDYSIELIEINGNRRKQSQVLYPDCTMYQHFYTNAMDGQLGLAGAFPFVVVWAGDLDGDARVDLLIRDTYGNNMVVGYSLWLSTNTEADKLLRLAARFVAVGC